MRPLQKDTQQLLITGGAITGTGLLAVLLLMTAFGGVGKHGPYNNSGWLALMLALGALPCGLLTLLLGLAKLLGELLSKD